MENGRSNKEMSKNIVKKTPKKNCTHTVMAKKIMELISEGCCTPFSMYDFLRIPKEKLNYHLKKMIDEGLITKYSRGIYDLTEAGEKRNVTFEKESNKHMIRLENMRFILPIYVGFERLMEHVREPKKSQLKNGVTQYTGKIKNLSIRVFVSKKSQTLEVTCEKKLGCNSYEIYYTARTQVEETLIGIIKDSEIKLGLLEPSMKPEWAVPHPFAETILDKTESSQIRTKNGIMNRSSGRNADWEVDNIIQAEKIMNMPNDIMKIHQKLDQITQQQGIYDGKVPPRGIYM